MSKEDNPFKKLNQSLSKASLQLLTLRQLQQRIDDLEELPGIDLDILNRLSDEVQRRQTTSKSEDERQILEELSTRLLSFSEKKRLRTLNLKQLQQQARTLIEARDVDLAPLRLLSEEVQSRIPTLQSEDERQILRKLELQLLRRRVEVSVERGEDNEIDELLDRAQELLRDPQRFDDDDDDDNPPRRVRLPRFGGGGGGMCMCSVPDESVDNEQCNEEKSEDGT